MQNETELAPFPIDAARWEAVIRTLQIGPQQARIAELVIRGKKDKEIMRELGIAKGTLRGYLERIHHRVGSQDRVELVVRLFAVALRLAEEKQRSPEC